MPQRSPQVEKITRKQSRLWIVDREGLKVGPAQPFQSKFSIRLLLLVDSKLKNFVAIISQPWFYYCKEVEMKTKRK